MKTTAKQQLAKAKLEADLLEQRARAAKARAVTRMSKLAAKGAKAYGDYANATRSRIRQGRRSRGGSSQSHLDSTTHDALRRDTRDLDRNNLTARAINKRCKDLTVGDGPIVKSTTDNPEWNTLADGEFNLFMLGLDFERLGHPDVRRRANMAQLCRQIVGAWPTDGDCLAVFTDEASTQLIESERICNPHGKQDTESIIGGVEVDRFSRAIKYHIGRWDPHGRLDSTDCTPVDAQHAMLMTNPYDDRIGMVRGEPGFQAAADRIEQLDNYIEKVGLAAEIATLFGLWIETDKPDELQSLFETASEQPSTEAGRPRQVELNPGEIYFGRKGEKATQIKPEFPTTTFREYVTAQLQLICADMGLPIALAFFDTTSLSWGNLKAQSAIAFRGLQVGQMELAKYVFEARRRKLEQWMDEGILPRNEQYARCEINFPGAPVFDFKGEVDGYGTAVERNLMTHDQATQALGTGRGVDVMAARSVETNEAKRLGLLTTVTPGSAVQNPEPRPEPDPTPKTEASTT